MMDSQRIQEDEIEWQYYNISSTNLIVQFKKFSLDTIKTNIDNLESQTLLALSPDSTSILRKQYAALYEEFKKVALAEINKVEGDIRGYFAIPYHVLSRADENDVPCSTEDIQMLEEEIEKLESEYKKKRALKYLLEKEVELINDLEGLMKQAQNIHGKITHYQEMNEPNSMAALLNVHKDLSKKIILLQSKHKYFIK